MSKQTKHKRSELRDFGSFLRKARETRGLTQTESAEQVTKEIARIDVSSDASVSQSLIAQLETGTNRNPDELLVRALSNVYKIPYSVLISELVKDKYKLEAVRADRLKEDILSIDELAQWERQVNAKALWIVAPNFIDDRHPAITSTVHDLLKKGTTISYFVNEADTLDGGRFSSFKILITRWFLEKLGTDVSDLIHCYPLKKEHTAWLATSFVIADPIEAYIHASSATSGKASGYYIIPEESGTPSYGIAISQGELRRLTGNLMIVIDALRRAPSQ
jgi:transcriptional regulator with XRE-family HTH domain